MLGRNCNFQTYRFFGVSEAGSVLWEKSFACAGDDEACVLAADISGAGMGVEVWEVARFVARVPQSEIAPN